MRKERFGGNRGEAGDGKPVTDETFPLGKRTRPCTLFARGIESVKVRLGEWQSNP